MAAHSKAFGWQGSLPAQICRVPTLPFLDPAIESSAGIPFLEATETTAFELKSNKGAANGYAGLDAGGKISLSLLPDANALESEAIAFAIALG